MNNFSMIEAENHDVPKLSSEENGIITADFTEKEVSGTIRQMEKNKSPRPDRFPAEFY